jgi:putative membrane protein
MSERVFLVPEAKERTRDAIRAIEGKTSAEVVVAVRHRAARHLRVSALFGAGIAAVVLIVMLVSPQTYDVRTIPLDVLLAFVLGVGLAQWTEVVRRRLSPARWLDAATERAAHRAFGELTIGNTGARTGLLVFVALLERRVSLVADQGVPSAIAPALESVRAELTLAVERLDFEAFELALLHLGETLASALPRRHDDVNELSDEVA